jgi:hypothetical protein
MSSLLTSACVRSFTELEQYYCYGCHFTEPLNTDLPDSEVEGDTGTIRLCKDYVERLWSGDYNSPTSEFDDCGMTLPDGDVVIPSKRFQNAEEFFNIIKPPLFDDYNIEIVENNKDCYNGGK